jgi:hypothetical protein
MPRLAAARCGNSFSPPDYAPGDEGSPRVRDGFQSEHGAGEPRRRRCRHLQACWRRPLFKRLGICIPEEYGGSGLGILEAGLMMRTIAESGGG